VDDIVQHRFMKGASVVDRETGARGVIHELLWWVDLRTDAPAVPAYVVWFHDGRRLRMVESALAPVA
jgi:uncharacterized membrane protein YfbV (UPF0208 family)